MSVVGRPLFHTRCKECLTSYPRFTELTGEVGPFESFIFPCHCGTAISLFNSEWLPADRIHDVSRFEYYFGGKLLSRTEEYSLYEIDEISTGPLETDELVEAHKHMIPRDGIVFSAASGKIEHEYGFDDITPDISSNISVIEDVETELLLGMAQLKIRIQPVKVVSYNY